MGKIKKAMACAGILAAAGIGEIAYFYRRTMKRGNAKVERTIKMSGTDWGQYAPFMEKRKTFMMAQTHEDVYQTSFDDLKLHATYFPAIEAGANKKKVRSVFTDIQARGCPITSDCQGTISRRDMRCCCRTRGHTARVRVSISVSVVWTERMPLCGSTG